MQKRQYEAPPYPYRARLDQRPPKQPVVVFMNDYQTGKATPFAAKGSLTLIITQTGIGKSTVCQHICMAAAMKKGRHADTLGFETRLDGGIVYYADMEMSLQEFDGKFLKMANGAGFTEEEDWKKNSNVVWDNYVAGLDAEQNLQQLSEQVNDLEQVDLVILDDIAHFVDDPNDYSQFKGLMKFLKAEILASESPAALIATIHANPGTSSTAREKKARGHLGTGMMNFASQIATIINHQETGVKTITTDKQHYDFCKSRLGNVATNYYKFDEDAKRFTSCEPPEHGGQAKEAVLNWAELFAEAEELPAKELETRVMARESCSSRTAQNRMKAAVENGSICKPRNGFYALDNTPF